MGGALSALAAEPARSAADRSAYGRYALRHFLNEAQIQTCLEAAVLKNVSDLQWF